MFLGASTGSVDVPRVPPVPKMKSFLWLTLLAAVSAQQNIEYIECPIPGNPSSVTQQQCDPYTACEFTSNMCHMKDNSQAGYVVSSDPVDTGRGFTVSLQKAVPGNTLFGADITDIVFEVIYHEDYHVQFQIYPASGTRYEVPFPVNLPVAQGSNPLYTVATSGLGQPFTFNITRISTGTNVFKMAGPLTYEDQFLQITNWLPSYYFYGIGEHSHKTLKRSFDSRQTSALFARDQPPNNGDANVNEYGTHPYYVNIEDDDGNTNSVLLYNSNAMEFSTFQMGLEPAVTARTIGGILDFHVFLGPTPEDVNIQYANTVGKPAFPPYWAFGFQLSRYGYNTISSYRTVYDRMIAAQIPWDVQTFDIDYMENYRDFTYDQNNWNGLPALIQELHDRNMKIILIKDPAIAIDWDNYPPSQNGKDNDIYIKWANAVDVPTDQPAGANDYMIGYVWPNNKTAFPDFINPATTTWWANELLTFYNVLNFDGAWIDMNEPANFGTNLNRPFNYPPELPDWSLKCPSNAQEDPPYATYATYTGYNECDRISDKTICMSGKQTNGVDTFLTYDTHNLYGYTETIATFNALANTVFPGQRPFVLSRSTFPGSGQYAAHWLGDNTADWEQFAMSVVGTIEFSMFGIPFAGPDVCGFFGEPSEELCIRWMQAGAFYPFDRNHNTLGTADQDPAKPGWTQAPVISKDVLTLRYKYIPFMYAKLHKAHLDGESVIRPLFNAFTTDFTAREINDQFIWGTELMVAPVLQQGATSRSVYFPAGLWYDLVSGALVASSPGMQTVQAPLDTIPVYVNGGSILPFQEPGITTTDSRVNPFGLTIGLASDGTAAGEVFWDDGVSEHADEATDTFLGIISYAQNSLSLVAQNNPASATGLMLQTIQIYGFTFNPSGIDVNGTPADPATWNYDSINSVLTFTLSVPLNADFTVDFIN